MNMNPSLGRFTHGQVARVDSMARTRALERQARLTKPGGALGRLEDLTVELAGLQGRDCPRVDRVDIVVFAADHGVAANGVSAYPQSVTAQMVGNMANGGAAISVLANSLGACLRLVDLGTVAPVAAHPAIESCRIASGTADWTRQAAMSAAQLESALGVGEATAQSAFERGSDLLIGGEMGIGNTTTAAALAALLLHRPAHEMAGAGTGLDDAGLAHKISTIESGLARHRPDSPMEAMRCVGGFELAALAGLYLSAARVGLPALVDGFPATLAALVACRQNPAVRDWLLFAHRSAEPGHQHILTELEAWPVLDLDMRLGEGSGAALAVPILQAACRLHAGMATFDEARVDEPPDAAEP